MKLQIWIRTVLTHGMVWAATCCFLGAGQTVASESNWSDGSAITILDQTADGVLAPAVSWAGLPERRWPGPSMWTNRLQDWVVRSGALECHTHRDAPCRTAHLITYELEDIRKPFYMSVAVDASTVADDGGFAGFLVGAGEGHLDYRGAAMVHHMPGRGGGLLAVMSTDGSGSLAFREMSRPETQRAYPELAANQLWNRAADGARKGVTLQLAGIPANQDVYTLRLSVWDEDGGLLSAAELENVSASRLRGTVALAASSDSPEGLTCRFRRFRIGGGRLVHHPGRTFGPIAGTLYSLSDGTLKLGAQFAHLGEAALSEDPDVPRAPRLRARLETRPVPDSQQPSTVESDWRQVGLPQAISPPDYYLLFRVARWDATRDWQTRVVLEDVDGTVYTYETLVRADPVKKPTVSLAAFTGMGVMGRIAAAGGPDPQEGQLIVGRWRPANVWMPFANAVRAVGQQDVDILFFTGDQIYEGKPSPKDFGWQPVEDYLYKWLLWHWSFRELTRNRPAIVQVDDHDVNHGNVWGWGGRVNLTGVNRDGGFLCSPYFVNMVQRTQTGHNPDAFDPGPADTGIRHYYTSLTYGGIGFAVLEDRKFKTPRSVTDPNDQVLLGARQLEFLDLWSRDWSGQAFKVVVSQSVYASMHVRPDGTLAKDYDSGGFPKAGRDKAVDLFRRCGALVVCGDQHLATLSRLGVKSPSDAVYQFCVPAMGNIFWRWFYPSTPGRDRDTGQPGHLGEFADPFGNYFRMMAVANPERAELLSNALRSRVVIPAGEAKAGLGDTVRASQGDGYGIVRFEKSSRQITIECWPHNASLSQSTGQFSGWPVILGFQELDGRRPVAWLPDLIIRGPQDPVVEIIDQTTGERVKTTRASKGFYRPGVFTPDHQYTLRVGDDGQKWWQRRNLVPSDQPGQAEFTVELELLSDDQSAR